MTQTHQWTVAHLPFTSLWRSIFADTCAICRRISARLRHFSRTTHERRSNDMAAATGWWWGSVSQWSITSGFSFSISDLAFVRKFKVKHWNTRIWNATSSVWFLRHRLLGETSLYGGISEAAKLRANSLRRLAEVAATAGNFDTAIENHHFQSLNQV